MFDADGTSVLVSNMSVEAEDVEEFPVLIGTEVAYFHRVDGGVNRQTGRDVVQFIHDVQGVGRPNHINPDQASHDFEAHLENYYNLDVTGVNVVDNYPDEAYVVEVLVDSYTSGPHSFSEALTKNIDKRATRYE